MPIDERLRRAFTDALGVDALDETASVTTVPEWDSLAHVNLVLALEQAFGVSFTSAEAANLLSVADIEQTLGTKGIVLAPS